MNDLSSAMDQEDKVVGILKIFSKAFDYIEHNIWLFNLEHYGIQGRVLDCFTDYSLTENNFMHINMSNIQCPKYHAV